MAIYFKGMTDLETTYLTEAMLKTGDELDLSAIKGVKVDKHSTGGVGDKTSLVVGPIVASLGVKFAKMSGRGLGHTGGTLDKLESIPGFNIQIPNEDFIKQVNKIGMAIVGQSANLALADKKLYSLRDVTGTVDSIPLIASSIMSKKLASGADVISLDVKVGSGAFMKDIESATKLAELMVQIGKNCGRSMTAILTNMDEPLGLAVGNSLEVIEAINTLKGKGPKDFTDLCYIFSAHLLIDANLAKTEDEALEMVKESIKSGKALETFKEFVKAQGGNPAVVDDYSLFEQAKYEINVLATKSGYVSKIDALTVGNASCILGAGREKLTDSVDHAVGIVLAKKVGDKVSNGDVLATIYANKENVDTEIKMLKDAFIIENEAKEMKLILKIVK
jgi:pyrimidine-nucleoside phosphorylase